MADVELQRLRTDYFRLRAENATLRAEIAQLRTRLRAANTARSVLRRRLARSAA